MLKTVEQLEETSDCHDETRERVTRTDNYLTHVYVTIGIVGVLCSPSSLPPSLPPLDQKILRKLTVIENHDV